MDFKEDIGSNVIIVGCFNIPLSSADRSSRQKITKEIATLNNTLDGMDFTDSYRTFHPRAAEHTFFSSAHGSSSKMDHVVGHKINLNKLKEIEILSSIFSDHNGMKQEINHYPFLGHFIPLPLVQRSKMEICNVQKSE